MNEISDIAFDPVLIDARVALDSLPLAVLITDEKGGLVAYANTAARRLASVIHADFHQGLERLVAAPPVGTRSATPTSDGCEDRIVCAVESGGVLTVIRQWRRCGDGSSLSTVTIRPATAETPEKGAVLTERETRILEQQNLMHAEKLATVGQLAAGMAHEINNPICYVQSNLGSLQDYMNRLFGLLEICEEVIRDERATAEERLAAVAARKNAIDFALIVEDLPLLLQESRDGVERIRQIVQNLRDFSRVEAVEGFRMFDIHRAINTTLSIVRSLCGSGIRFETHFDHLPLIECNPTELNQVLMNILVNASQAVGADGLIEICTGLGKRCVWIEIKDNGHGIEEHILPRIFEPFFTTKKVGHGTGLGLSISYGIIKKHSGELTVRSRVGEGTTFFISLPIRQKSDAQNIDGRQGGAK